MQERKHPSEGGRQAENDIWYKPNPESSGLISSERYVEMYYLIGLMIWRRGLFGGL